MQEQQKRGRLVRGRSRAPAQGSQRTQSCTELSTRREGCTTKRRHQEKEGSNLRNRARRRPANPSLPPLSSTPLPSPPNKKPPRQHQKPETQETKNLNGTHCSLGNPTRINSRRRFRDWVWGWTGPATSCCQEQNLRRANDGTSHTMAERKGGDQLPQVPLPE